MGESLSWTQPICERCWIEQESESDGEMITGIRVPVRVMDVIEQCSWCGKITIFGAFKRANPATVPFPAAGDNDDVEAPTQPFVGLPDDSNPYVPDA